jgi:hypothetical protein
MQNLSQRTQKIKLTFSTFVSTTYVSIFVEFEDKMKPHQFVHQRKMRVQRRAKTCFILRKKPRACLINI